MDRSACDLVSPPLFLSLFLTLSLCLSASLSNIPKGAITHLNQPLVWPTLPQLKRVGVTNSLQIKLVKILKC